jgi:hypothetical protein
VLKLSQLLSNLTEEWQFLGMVDGLRAHGAPDFPSLLKNAALGLPGSRAAPLVLVAGADFEDKWVSILGDLLRDPQALPIVLWANNEPLYEHPRLAQMVSGLRRQASLALRRPAAEVHILQAHPPKGRMIRFLSATQGWVALGGPGEEFMATLAAQVDIPRRERDPDLPFSPTPWPIATQARLRLFAWPDWEDPADLEFLLSRYAALLLGRQDSCLCLRRDPRLDPPAEQAIQNLSSAFERCLGSESTLDLLVIDETLNAHEWLRLGRAMDATLWLGSSEQSRRLPMLEKLDVHRVQNPMALQRLFERSDGLAPESYQVQMLILDPAIPALSEHP